MVVSNQTNRVSVIGAGAVLAIPYPFPTVASGDLKVIERVIATGVPTELTEGASSDGYTATYGAGGGTVTTSDSIASTSQVHVIRDTDMTQTLLLVQGGDFSAPNIETAFDKSVKLVIENADQLTRTLKFPNTDPSSSFADMPSSIDRASKNLTFDSAGKPTASSSCLTGSVSFTTIGTNIAEAANATAVRTLLALGWFDARAAISSGAGTSGDPWLLSDVSANVNVFFPVAGYYKLTANWNILTNGHIWGTKGVFLDPDTYTFECSGTVSATTTDLTADGGKSAMSVTVGDESSFSADDWIEISASKDVYSEWATKTLPRELNQVVSTAANTLNLKYPLRREYDYDGGFSDNPTVTLITTVKENVVIENINIQGDIAFGYINNFALRGITTEVLTISQVAKSFEITNVEATLPVGTGDNRAVNFEGASEGLISIRTYGAKDGIRIWGCAEISGSMIVKQCDQRAIWIYGSDDINLSPVNVLGTRTNTTNHEILLFDNCGFCSIRNAFVKETGKTGENPAVVEFRAVRDWCEFTDSEVFGYSSILVVLKPERIYAVIDRNKFHIVSDVVTVCGFDSGIAAVSDSVVKIRDNEVIDAGDTAHLLRTATAFTLTTDDIKHVEVSGNKMPVGSSQFLIILAAGSTNTKGIETLVVTNNTVEILTAGISSGCIYNGGDFHFPVRTLVYNGNTQVQNAGKADSFEQVTNLITVDHTVTRIVCNENQSVCNENVIVEN